MPVSYAVSAFRKASFARRGGVLELHPCDSTSLGDARAALDEVAEQVAGRMVLDEGWQATDAHVSAGPAVISDDRVLLPLVSPTPPGFVADFLDLVARGLEARGIAGKLTPATHVIDHHFESNAIPTISTAMRLPIDVEALFETWDPHRRACAPGWYATVEDSRAVLEPALAWVTEIGGETTFSFNGTTISIEPAAARPLLEGMLSGRKRISLQVRTASSKRRMRSLTCNNFGWAAAASYDDEQRDALTQISMMTDLLRAAAPHVLCGWVRSSSTLSTHVVPGSELLSHIGGTTAPVAHLEGDWLHDVFGVQLVSADVLARILATDDWSSESLGDDKHLVRAAAPAEWFDTNPLAYDLRQPPYETSALPSAGIRQDARAAFDAVLLKPPTLSDQPTPLDSRGRAD